ncbi:MAG TPA: sigma factor [Actinoallomurus sp.]|nr:sigma factor [Actinoallomurus sp.]
MTRPEVPGRRPGTWCSRPEVFRRYAPDIKRYVTRRLGIEAAEDVVAETFLAAFRPRDGHDLSRPNARPWLYGIATNLMGRQVRTEVRPVD